VSEVEQRRPFRRRDVVPVRVRSHCRHHAHPAVQQLPHFLFNTLHSLLALVRQDPGRAEEAIEQFGDILRYTFAAGDGSEERTLQQEWQLVDNYLALERLRLGARLRVTASLDVDVAAVPLPVLTLQPLVENAVRHAIAPRAAGGRVDVHARRHDGRVRITVSDDGPGLTSSPRNGRGLDLVRQRLDRMYGDRATLALGPSDEGGLCVTIDFSLGVRWRQPPLWYAAAPAAAGATRAVTPSPHS
jgi:sensor histidine kinase YesM